jgi:hypothetical protein
MFKIDNEEEFERVFNKRFGDIDRNTLSKIKDDRLRIELGGKKDGSARLPQILSRCNSILRFCFDNKVFWLRIILWSDKEEINLKNAGFSFHKASKVFRLKGEYETLYMHFNRYSKTFALPIIKSIVNFDMAEEPSANITCYFVSFSRPLIINIYDDRGLDIYSPNKELLNRTRKEFFDLIM